MWSTASASRKSTKLPAGPDGARCSRRRLAIIDACECVLAALAIAAPCALVSWFGGGSGATLDPGTEEKAPRGTRRLWGRPSPGEKEAPWDIIGGMTDDRLAYQLAQRPTGPFVSLWITRRRCNEGGNQSAAVARYAKQATCWLADRARELASRGAETGAQTTSVTRALRT